MADTERGLPYLLAFRTQAPSRLAAKGRVVCVEPSFRGRRLVSASVFALLLPLGASAGKDGEPRFTTREVGSRGLNESRVGRALNDAGDVTGRSEGELGTAAHAVLWWHDATATDIGELFAGGHSEANALTALGEAAGSSNAAAGLRAFVFDPRGGPRDLGTLPGDTCSEALGMNEAGEVVGVSSGPKGMRAVRWSARGDAIGLAALRGAEFARAIAIAASGEAVGLSGRASRTRAVLWPRQGAPVDLGVLPGDDASAAFGINADGEVVGQSSRRSAIRPFRWTRAHGMTALPLLPGHDFGRAVAIDSSGNVVGSSGEHHGAHAVLWTADGTVHDLNDALGSASGVELGEAVGINDRGQILVLGQAHDGASEGHDEGPTRVFLLDPVVAP